MIFGPDDLGVQLVGIGAPPPRQPPRGAYHRSRFTAPTLLGSRVLLTPTPAAGAYAPFGRTIGWFDADTTYGNRFQSTAKELLLAKNTSGAPLSVYVRGAPDANLGRSADQVLSIEAGDIASFGPFPFNGWRQSDGYVWVDADSSSIKFAVVVLPQ